MDDLISRQALLQALCNEDGAQHEYCYPCKTVLDVVNAQPSAQSEIMKCKDCKHKPSGSGANHDISFPDGVCPCQCEDCWYSWMPKDDWFCGSWERREE